MPPGSAPPPRTWACAEAITARAKAPANRVMPRVLLLSVVFRMRGPPACGQSAASRVLYVRAPGILPCRQAAVGFYSDSGRQQAVAVARIAARAAEVARFAGQVLLHFGRGAFAGRVQ